MKNTHKPTNRKGTIELKIAIVMLSIIAIPLIIAIHQVLTSGGPLYEFLRMGLWTFAPFAIMIIIFAVVMWGLWAVNTIFQSLTNGMADQKPPRGLPPKKTLKRGVKPRKKEKVK